MALEREHKFLVLGPFPTFEALHPAFSAYGVSLFPQASRDQHDLYYDLPGYVLKAAGTTLRVRRLAGETLATLKLPGEVRGSLHEREELELPVTGRVEGGEGWPGLICERLGELGYADLSDLKPFLELSTRRSRVMLHRKAQPVAELSFDEVTAQRPSTPYVVRFRELELEAHPDVPDAAFNEVARILQLRFPLEPHTQDKVTHALQLLGEGPDSHP